MPSNSIILGTDLVAPIREQSGLWRMWSISNVFTGGPGENRYVPNVNDYVIVPATFETFIVRSVDPQTWIPVLEPISPDGIPKAPIENTIFGGAPVVPTSHYLCYVDKSVTPYALSVESRLLLPGSANRFAKIFKGIDLSETGNVISRVYDSSGNFISQSVQLELASIDSHTNHAIKTVPPMSTVEDLLDGEELYLVVYNDAGHVTQKHKLLVENTSFIRSPAVGLKYISHISMSCAFMSPTHSDLINFPLNVPLNALNLMGNVHYSDGSTLQLPVDGTKFSILGLNQHVSAIVGQELDLVLRYTMSPTEAAYAGISADGHHITEAYKMVTVNPNNSYTVKLFAYPVWMGEFVGYELRYFLFNLDRNIWHDVTSLVRYSSSHGGYNPLQYGYVQTKSVSLNLRDVSMAYQNFVHTQMMTFTLYDRAELLSDSWVVDNETTGVGGSYGTGIRALKPGPSQLTIGCGAIDLNQWLSKVYLKTKPLVDVTRELAPVTPTHFVLHYGNMVQEFPIHQWNSTLNTQTDIPLYSTIFIRFIKRYGTIDMQLSMAAMLVKSN